MGFNNLHLNFKAFQTRKSIARGGEDSNSESKKCNSKTQWMKPISHGYHVVEGRSTTEEFNEVEYSQPDTIVLRREQVQGNEVWIFGVFDARIGDGFTKYMQSHILEKKPRESRVKKNMKEIMRRAYLGGRTKISEGDKTKDMGSASAIIINGEKLVISDVGNYKAIVCRSGVAYQINRRLQRTSNRSWSAKLVPACGIVCSWGVNKTDKSSDIVVGSERIESDTEFLILGSPGIWKVMRHQEAVSLVSHIEDPQEAAECLAKEALTRMSRSSISCLIVRFE